MLAHHYYIVIWLRRNKRYSILYSILFSGWNLHGVPSRDSNSGLPYIKPMCYQLSHTAPCNVTIVYGNSQDYAQKPHRYCTFMNSASVLLN